MRTYDPATHEPCKPEPHPGQEEITINGFTFYADKNLIPLLKALNDAGVQTYSHCAGHGKDRCAWVVLELDGLHVEVRPNMGRSQIVLTWTPPWAEEAEDETLARET